MTLLPAVPVADREDVSDDRLRRDIDDQKEPMDDAEAERRLGRPPTAFDDLSDDQLRRIPGRLRANVICAGLVALGVGSWAGIGYMLARVHGDLNASVHMHRGSGPVWVAVILLVVFGVVVILLGWATRRRLVGNRQLADEILDRRMAGLEPRVSERLR